MDNRAIQRIATEHALDLWRAELAEYDNISLASLVHAAIDEMVRRKGSDPVAAYLTEAIKQHMVGKDA